MILRCCAVLRYFGSVCSAACRFIFAEYPSLLELQQFLFHSEGNTKFSTHYTAECDIRKTFDTIECPNIFVSTI